MTNTTDIPIICFDGICNLCHRSVRWVIRRDRKEIFRFTSLQSKTAARLLAGWGTGAPLDGVILVCGDQIWSKSDAWIQIFKRLGPRWSWLGSLQIFPKKLRDRVYDVIASNRYSWFGKLDACPAPDPRWKNRFLD